MHRSCTPGVRAKDSELGHAVIRLNNVEDPETQALFRRKPIRPRDSAPMLQTHLFAHMFSCSVVQHEGWRFVPNAILPGHRRALQWVLARTPTVHWGVVVLEVPGRPRGGKLPLSGTGGREREPQTGKQLSANVLY